MPRCHCPRMFGVCVCGGGGGGTTAPPHPRRAHQHPRHACPRSHMPGCPPDQPRAHGTRRARRCEPPCHTHRRPARQPAAQTRACCAQAVGAGGHAPAACTAARPGVCAACAHTTIAGRKLLCPVRELGRGRALESWQVLRGMWMLCPNQASSLQGCHGVNCASLAVANWGNGSGWQHRRQNSVLLAVVGQWS